MRTFRGSSPSPRCSRELELLPTLALLARSRTRTSSSLRASHSVLSEDGQLTLLSSSGSILTVEARHSAFIRLLNSRLPAPAPYDTPQSAAAVVSMATRMSLLLHGMTFLTYRSLAAFFVSCPEGSAPAIMGLPALVIGGDASAVPALGGSLTLAPADAMLADSFPAEVFCGFAAFVFVPPVFDLAPR